MAVMRELLRKLSGVIADGVLVLHTYAERLKRSTSTEFPYLAYIYLSPRRSKDDLIQLARKYLVQEN